MRLHDVRGASGTDKGQALVQRLFLALGRGDWAKAAPSVADPIDIFGREVSREEFARNEDASLRGVLERLEELPGGEVDPAQLGELVGIPLRDEDRVFFATTRVEEEPVTFGLIVAESDRAVCVRALFDPRAFKAWALEGSEVE